MFNLLSAFLGRSLLIMIGLHSVKKQEPGTWNKYAEFTCVVNKTQNDQIEFTFRKDTLTFTITKFGKQDSVNYVFSEQQQTQLISEIENNKFFHLSSSGEKGVDDSEIILIYTKDHFQKKVQLPHKKKERLRFNNIVGTVFKIARENGINFSSYYSE